jgi:putative transposase
MCEGRAIMEKEKINIIYPNQYYHVYNRGSEKRTIFYDDRDYGYVLEKIIFYRDIINIKCLAYCLLPNHYHFILKGPSTPGVVDPRGRYKLNVNQFKGSAIAKFMGLLANSHTKYFNCKYDHSGRLFQGPFQYKLITDDNYLRNLVYYINLNPLKHRIVKNIEDWLYTSHYDYFDKKKDRLVDDEFLVDFDDYKEDLISYIEDVRDKDYEF